MKYLNLLWCVMVLSVVVPGWMDDNQDSTKRRHTPNIPCEINNKTHGVCVPVASCPALYSYSQGLNKKYCSVDNANTQGVCCPSNPISENNDTIFRRKERAAAMTTAAQLLEKRNQLEKTLLARGLVVRPDTSEAMHNRITCAFEKAIRLGEMGYISSESTRYARANEYGKSAPSSDDEGPLADDCPKDPVCEYSKYRTIDGSCNNVENTAWGMANRAFQRMTPPTYADGISKPRVAADGGDLPSCRLVSSVIIQDKSKEYTHIASMFMGFGQFIDHDLTLTPAATGANNSGILCCPPLIEPEFNHPECMKISIPTDDPFYSQFKQSCMEFVRTIPAPRPDCKSGPREQINQLTNYLDGSMIYGSSDDQTKNLRDKIGGRLRVSSYSGREFPPHKSTIDCDGDVNRGILCFVGGDARVRIQPVITVLHIVFLREHNRIAALLEQLNPSWNDEILFQEARRIIQAQLQHITFNEFLPVLLGEAEMKQLNKKFEYDSSLDVTILNEFSTAAFRFGHSLVQSEVKLVGSGRTQSRRLGSLILKPFDSNLLDDLIRGATTQASQLMDENVTPELTNHMFETNNKFGQDLAALDCQRGRDHAIGTYTQLREVCGLPPVESFSDLTDYMNDDVAERISKVYTSVDDIDLWMGGVAEKPMPGAVVGPTFGCIIAEQFKKLRLGDRMWYEILDTDSSFSRAQLSEIRKTSLARILCDNTNLDEIQPLALLTESPQWNAKVSCKSGAIPSVDISFWKNEPI